MPGSTKWSYASIVPVTNVGQTVSERERQLYSFWSPAHASASPLAWCVPECALHFLSGTYVGDCSNRVCACDDYLRATASNMITQ